MDRICLITFSQGTPRFTRCPGRSRRHLHLQLQGRHLLCLLGLESGFFYSACVFKWHTAVPTSTLIDHLKKKFRVNSKYSKTSFYSTNDCLQLDCVWPPRLSPSPLSPGFFLNSTSSITRMTRLRAFFFFDYMLFINFTNHFTLVKLERRTRSLKHHRLTASVIRVTENLFGGLIEI